MCIQYITLAGAVCRCQPRRVTQVSERAAGIYLYIYIYTYIPTCIHLCIYIYICAYIPWALAARRCLPHRVGPASARAAGARARTASRRIRRWSGRRGPYIYIRTYIHTLYIYMCVYSYVYLGRGLHADARGTV